VLLYIIDSEEQAMGKFIVLGGFMGSDEDYEVIAYADTYSEAEAAITLYVDADPIVEYDFYVIEG
jgi:hypothetical protein